jgi:hypothetical protein
LAITVDAPGEFSSAAANPIHNARDDMQSELKTPAVVMYTGRDKKESS